MIACALPISNMNMLPLMLLCLQPSPDFQSLNALLMPRLCAAQEVNGQLKQGNLTKSSFDKGPMSKKDPNELMQRFNDNDVYVLVTTTDHPEGLLRGQVHRKNDTSSP